MLSWVQSRRTTCAGLRPFRLPPTKQQHDDEYSFFSWRSRELLDNDGVITSNGECACTQGRNNWGVWGVRTPPNLFRPLQHFGNIFLGGVHVQYLSCTFTSFAMLFQLSEFVRQECHTLAPNPMLQIRQMQYHVQNDVPFFPASACFLSVSGNKCN